MGAGLHYAKNLFQGTAEYYERYRPPYPDSLLHDLRARVPLSDVSRVLDLACGTGQIAFLLAGIAGDIWAVDQEDELVRYGERKARRLGIGNIRWVTAAAEQLTPEEGNLDLVAIGNAFHRLDRDAVTRRLVPNLKVGGCVALVWGAGPWLGPEAGQGVLDEALGAWMDRLGARDRIPEGWARAMVDDPHEQVLRRAGLVYEGRYEFSAVQRWTVESLIGYVYSTSFLNRNVVGDRAEAFESDLRTRLLRCAPDGSFEQELSFAYELARRALVS